MRHIPKLAAVVGAVTIGLLGCQGVASAGMGANQTDRLRLRPRQVGLLPTATTEASPSPSDASRLSRYDDDNVYFDNNNHHYSAADDYDSPA
jgi:hypothetical protein